MKISETDFDIFREKLKIENYVENMSQDAEECLEPSSSAATTPQQQQQQPPPPVQQMLIANDDMSDYVEHGQQYSFSDTLDAESAFVNHDDGIQVNIFVFLLRLFNQKRSSYITRLNICLNYTYLFRHYQTNVIKSVEVLKKKYSYLEQQPMAAIIQLMVVPVELNLNRL